MVSALGPTSSDLIHSDLICLGTLTTPMQVWGEGLQPGQRFDAGKCSPLLIHLLTNGTVPVTDRRILVPGCGRGYDVTAAAQAGVSLAVGLDICALAVKAAEEHRDATLKGEVAARAHFEKCEGGHMGVQGWEASVQGW